MIRVLQCVNNMQRAGLETMLMNYYRSIDREKIQFDFLTHRPDRSDYDDEIESLGGRIYRAPRLYPQNYLAYFSFMRRFFAEHPEYRIVHSHIDAMSYLPLLAAKRAGVPIRIAHSHSTSIDPGLKYPVKQLFRFQLDNVATHRFSCGQAAGEFLFRGREFQLIPNAIDADRFSFDQNLRRVKRQELGLENKFVVGHAGRFTAVKNHEFLLRLCSRLLQTEADSILLLVGTGELEQKTRDLAEKLGISECVKFLGNRSDISDLYQAMDILVMPSLFEGVPLVGLEAQFAGLPCIFSDRVSREVQFTENCSFLSLSQSLDSWTEEIVRLGKAERAANTGPCGYYDMKHARQLLEACYMELDSTVVSV